MFIELGVACILGPGIVEADESLGGNRTEGLVDTTGRDGGIPGGPDAIGVPGTSWW